MGIAADAFSVSHNIGGYMDAMDRHHDIREFAFGLLDAVGAPITLIAIVHVRGDKFLGRETRARQPRVERVRRRNISRFRFRRAGDPRELFVHLSR